MYRIVCRYLDGPWGSPSHQLKSLLEDANRSPRESKHMTAVTQLWCEIFGQEQVWLDTAVCAACFAILWMALKGEGISSPVATSLDAAAGLAQRQKWGLILPSSARVSRLTYQTVIGVRYPELVRPTPTGWQYGRYVSEEATLQGGFLPVFWDVPKSTMHAVSDVGALVEWLQEHIAFGQNSADNLAVLHNQNHMVHEFGLSAWVTQSGRQVISRSVTSCAGMTAYMVVVAQTKVGFLTGGRGEKFRSLPEEERRTQEEEAFARATVALTRARKICVIFCPLDMKGLIGAATVMGSLMYGAGHCWNGTVNMHLRQPSLDECLGDNQFLSFLDHDDVPPDRTAQRRYPPVALIECVADLTQPHYKVRRLHLVIVDLWRPWKIHKSQVRSITDQLRRLQPGPQADHTTPMMPMSSKTPLHGRRFVYGYSLDGSDFPCYLIWPWRTAGNSFFLLESQSRRYVDLDQAGFLHPLGLRHFYDGFSLRAEMSIRPAALAAFDLREDELSTDLVVSQAAVVDRGWMDHQEQPVDQNAPEADRRNVPEEVISVSDGEVDRESTIGGCSSQASCSTTSSDDDSDISEPARSEVSVQDSIMEHAYHSLQNAFTVEEGQLVGGDGTLNQLELLPFHWPLAKLTLPLKFGVNRLEGLVTGFLMELMATRSEPWLCRRRISSFAKTLTVHVATYLAKEIASLFRPVLQHPVMALTDDDTLSLLTSDFWIRPVYEELLYAASRFNRSSGAEHKRPTSNLVKIASFSKDKTSDMMNAGTHHTTMTEWIGADCPVDFLNAWFPAHWAPIVLRELHRREEAYRKAHKLWFDNPHASDLPRVKDQRKDALRSRELHYQIGALDNRKNLPTFMGKLKIDWLDFPVDDILQQFTTLKDGILRGVFKQQTARAWYGCRAEKAQVTVLLPGQCDCSMWSDLVDGMPHSWPKSFNIGRMQISPITATSFHRLRKFTRARHMWLHLEPDWNLLWNQLYTDWPGIHTYDEINDRLFVNPGRNENILDVKSKVERNSPEYWQWRGQIDYMWRFQDGQVPLVQVKMADAIAEYQTNLRKEQAEVALHRPLARKQWKTKDGIFQVKQNPSVYDDPSADPNDQMDETSPEQEEATFSKMLRDV